MIPSDWEVKTFCELFDILPNNTLSRAELNKEYGSYKNVHYGDVLVEFGEWIDCSNIDLPFINSNAKFNHTVLQDGDIVIADTAEDETVGKSTEITNTKNKKIVSGLHTIPIRPKIKFAAKWLGYYINSACWHDQILPFITGTKVSAISKAAVSQTKFFYPEKIEEQKKIATALSDVDTLIANLEKLIAKKKNIKQGAMQQLLTGKKRLPGFGSDERQKECHSERSAKREVEESSGYKMTELGLIPSDWEFEIFGKLVSIYRGGSPRPIEAYITTNPSGINWIKIGDVDEGAKYITSTQERIIPEGKSRSREVHKGDFILSNSMSFGRPYILKVDGCIHDGWLTIQDYQDTFDTDFLYYMLSSEVVFNQYVSMAAGSSVQNLNKEKVAAVKLFYPPSKTEQTAIANVLSDMDTEISALETKLAKYRTLKTGMMQQLLTGKIRLV